jgi:Concanavalin A-like lectin/glucanases superfamily/Secretion system C-terminal sorting domain
MNKKKLLLITTRLMVLVVLLVAQLPFSVSAQIPSFIPTAGLRAWYPFSGNANDSSGNMHHGIAYGGISYRTDRFGNPAHSLQGNAASAIDIPWHNFPLGDSSRSVSVYFRIDSTYPGGGRSLISWGSNVFGGRFGLFTNDSMIGLEYVNGTVLTRYVPDTFWHNLIVTYSMASGGSAGVQLYFDGMPVAAPIVNNPIASFNTDTGLWHNIAGSLYYGPLYTDSWSGEIDDVAVWDRELTPCEALEIAYNGQVYSAGHITGRDTVCPGASTLLTVVGGIGAGNWSVTNATLATISSGGMLTGVSSGLDTVKYIVVNPCGSDTAIYRIRVLPLAICKSSVPVPGAEVANQGLIIYPNPVKDKINIRVNTMCGESIPTHIVDMKGNRVSELALVPNQEYETRFLFPKGVYMVIVHTCSGDLTQRFTVE